MYKILDVNDKMWDEYLEKFPDKLQDIYYTSNYYRLYEENGDGKARLFVYEEKEKLGIYPFLINEIKCNLDEKYYDIQSAYGYGGPLIACDSKEFAKKFENEFLKFCFENNIIAEFIRFHPLVKNENVFCKNITKSHNRNTVYLDLNKGIQRIWNEDIKSKNRNMIRKAEKNNLIVEVSRDFKKFKQIYLKTMANVNAQEYYYFSDNYYDNIENSKDCILLDVKMDGEIIASAVFIYYGEYFHYHLSGSIKKYCSFAPNNLLIWEAIKIAVCNGNKFFHLGGGLTDSLDDSLFKFKNSFSKEIADFYIGKRIHNKAVYEQLIYEWEKNNNRKATLFLQYRY